MATTPVDLYRLGNAAGARLDRPRPGKDVIQYLRNDAFWVRSRSGGVSTTANRPSGPGIWWRLPAGAAYDEGVLFVWNDHGNHWSWEPAFDMPWTDFVEALVQANRLFIRA
ncbi:hypothetical protein [Desertibaculum subflavum]|uniref:hypothetical protein n=1 Tax=Desertibaculum subflavum TaxID=2268458 RepID=UPI000E660914